MRSLEHIQKTFTASDNDPTAVLCLASIIQYHGGTANLEYLISLSQTINGITRLSNLVKAAESVGLKAIGGKSALDSLKIISIPVILHVRNDIGDSDFVVCYGFYDNYFLLGIPSWGLMQFREEEMEIVWESRIMLYLEPTSSFVLKQNLIRKSFQYLISKIYK